MDKTFEIRDGEIDVNGILNKIRENVEKRYSGGKVDLVEKYEEKRKEAKVTLPSLKDLDRDISYIADHHDINNNSYTISSHRPITGKFLVKGREAVHGEVRRYVDPAIYRQVELNRRIADALRLEKENIGRLEDGMGAVSSSLEAQVASLRSSDNSLRELVKKELSDNLPELVRKEVAGQLSALSGLVSREVQNRSWMANTLAADAASSPGVKQEYIDTINYFIFSEEMGAAWNRIGGASCDQPNVYTDTVQLFHNCKNVLDIGCGKGYFLQLLKESGISGYGIDTNEDYLLLCKRSGLDVKKEDALSHLRALDDKALDGIFIGHLVEHLAPREIIELVRLCYEKLQHGTHLVILTPNVLSMLVSTNLFYMDPTHRTHVHPEVMKFTLRASGFRDIGERFYQPISSDKTLGRLDCPSGEANGPIKDLVDACNANFEKLNDRMFGYRDYAVFAKK